MRHVDIVDDENRKPAACKADYNCNQTLRHFGFLHFHPKEFWIIYWWENTKWGIRYYFKTSRFDDECQIMSLVFCFWFYQQQPRTKSPKNLFPTTLLWVFQLGVTVLPVVSAFKGKNIPQNNLVLSPEPLICGTIYEWVYGATQVN